MEAGIRIVPTTDALVPALRECVDRVARERRFLAIVEAHPVEAMRAFVQGVHEGGGVHLVAVDGDGRVVAWCDIARHQGEGFRHAGRLGMGVLPEARSRGLGERLLRAALDAARERGIERVELEAFASNRRAIALYERLGFAHEGIRPRARKIDGRYDDDVLMGILLDG